MIEITNVELSKNIVWTGESLIIMVTIEERMDYPYDYPYDYPIENKDS